jgi:hypothetical protein
MDKYLKNNQALWNDKNGYRAIGALKETSRTREVFIKAAKA